MGAARGSCCTAAAGSSPPRAAAGRTSRCSGCRQAAPHRRRQRCWRAAGREGPRSCSPQEEAGVSSFWPARVGLVSPGGQRRCFRPRLSRGGPMGRKESSGDAALLGAATSAVVLAAAACCLLLCRRWAAGLVDWATGAASWSHLRPARSGLCCQLAVVPTTPPVNAL